MKILSIETSCDETAISLLDVKKNKNALNFKILGNALASQAKIHAKYGGVFPMMAKREHAKNLPKLFEKVLKDSKFFKKSKIEIKSSQKKNLEKILEREHKLSKKLLKIISKIERPNVDLISVTSGPGLEPALWVGINFARALSNFWNIPLIPINHMEGHIVSSFLEEKNGFLNMEKINFPVLALLISGGHTEIVIAKKIGSYKIIGQTRDDAAGEAFDKVARMLGLPYPGGPEISKIAESGKLNPKYKLPRPMISSNDYDFSFSGLKTAVLYMVKKIKKLNLQDKRDIAKEFENSVTEVLTSKTLKALKMYNAKTLIIGGGVSANKKIRKEFTNRIEKEFPKVKLYLPNPKLSTDNALMIGVAGYFRRNDKKPLNIRAEGNLSV